MMYIAAHGKYFYFSCIYSKQTIAGAGIHTSCASENSAWEQAEHMEEEMLNLPKSGVELNDFHVTGDNEIQMYKYCDGYEIQEQMSLT